MASAKNKIDGSIKNRVLDFLQKLQLDDTTPGLHIEPMKQARDRRARTGRVTDEWRAVLFRIDGKAGTHYVYYGTWHHNEAIKIARSTVLTMNLSLGVPEFEDWGLPGEPESGGGHQSEVPEAPTVEKPVEPEPGEESGEVTGQEGADVVPGWVNRLPEVWTAERLTAEAGIRAEGAERALGSGTLGELNAVIDSLPEAQGLVLLGLANGEELTEIREELGLTRLAAAGGARAETTEDETLDRALRDTAVGFVFVGESPRELKDAFESLDIDRWRVFLHPEQRKYVTGRWKGSYRLSGGAGTGKTVVLVHRARDLHAEDPGSRLLLTTFTRTLADALAQQVKRLDPELPQVPMGTTGLTIAGMDQVAAKVVGSASARELEDARAAVLGRGQNALSQRLGQTKDAWLAAVDISGPQAAEALLEPTFLEQEYISVVLAHGVAEEKDYLRASRQGRGTALNRAARKELWKVFAQFRRTNQMSDAVTYPEMAALAAAVLRSRAERGDRLPFDHVLVDEAQDFHAAHWLLLRALVAEGPDDLFIAEDSHQRIYGQKVPLSRFGIQIRGRSRRLRLNYRTTAENLAYAVTLLEGGDFTDMEDEAEQSGDYRSVRSGPVPRVVRADDVAGELQAVVDAVGAWLADKVSPEAVAVLVRSGQTIQRVASALDAAEIRNGSPAKGDTAGRGKVTVMTMHSAKGMEFERVVVMGGDSASATSRFGVDRLPEAEQQDALLRERSLHYVAATRARDELVVTTSGLVRQT